MGVNAIVGQSGGPTSVINASLAGVYSACHAAGIPTLYGMRHGVQGLLQGKHVNLSAALSQEGALELLKRTPASFLGSCRYKLPAPGADDAVYDALFDALSQLDIGYFFYIGGNDSMDTILKLSDAAAARGSDVRFIGVPKTIDNDLACTDHTPGYGSAAKYIATTVKELVRDATIYDMRSVTVVEIMGRNAGWLTAAAALAEDEDCEGAALICLPETPFDPEHFIARIREQMALTPSLLVAVSEGIRLADGRYVCEMAEDALSVDAFGHKMLGGTGRCLCSLIGARLGVKTRAVELSTLQRCAAHVSSGVDVAEAFAAGEAAVRAALAGETGRMICFVRKSDAPYQCGVASIDIHHVANLERTVPADWIDAERYGLRAPFYAYASPLIQEEVTPIYRHGLPTHLTLHK